MSTAVTRTTLRLYCDWCAASQVFAVGCRAEDLLAHPKALELLAAKAMWRSDGTGTVCPECLKTKPTAVNNP